MRELQSARLGLEEISEQIAWAQKLRHGLRPLVTVICYFGLFAGLSSLSGLFEFSPGVHAWYLPAGLNLGLLLGFGLQFAPLVLIAELASNFVLHPLHGSLLGASILSVTIWAVYVAAALGIGRFVHDGSVRLKHRKEIGAFLTIGSAAAAALSATLNVNLAAFEIIEWRQVPSSILQGALGIGVGFISVAPLVVVHGRSLVRRLSSGKLVNTASLTHPVNFRLHYSILFFAALAAALWVIFRLQVPGDFQIFCLLSVPMVLVSWKFGVEGSAASIFTMTCGIMGVLLNLKFAGENGIGLQMLLLVSSINGLLVGTPVSERRVAEGLLQSRDKILEVVRFAAEQLSKGISDNGIGEVLRRVGEVTGVSRVYLLENHLNDSGAVGESQPQEWVAADALSDPHDSNVLNVLRSRLVAEHAKTLAEARAFYQQTRDLPKRERDILLALDIRSVLVVPIFVDQQWWGCLGLDQSDAESSWPEEEIAALSTAGQAIGVLLASLRVEQQFRQLTGNIQAVFWISSPDGIAKNYVSPAYSEIWGRSPASLYQEPQSWLESVYWEDLPHVKASLAKQAWGQYDEEYRVVRPDRSIRWVRDRAFPVRDQSGNVYRVVGIAEDITEQKKVEEKLRATTVLLYSMIDNLGYGILVEDESRHITHVNQAFCAAFEIPVQRESLLGIDSRMLFLKPQIFSERIQEIIKSGAPSLGEELALADGRIFRRDYIPLSIGDEYRYHLWQYHDVTADKRVEEQIKGSLREKEVLLKEIHHRVKNNLQVISSLLNLQAAKIQDADARQTFKESQNRVRAMALIHERLYESQDLAKIDFAGYVRSLTSNLTRSYQVNTNIRLRLEVDPIPLSIDVAIPCGLIINELVSNSLKYAFPDGRGGEVNVRFVQEGNQRLRLVVRDNGVGCSPEINLQETSSLGLQLVQSLTSQLGGSFMYRNNGGLEFDIGFPKVKV